MATWIGVNRRVIGLDIKGREVDKIYINALARNAIRSGSMNSNAVIINGARLMSLLTFSL